METRIEPVINEILGEWVCSSRTVPVREQIDWWETQLRRAYLCGQLEQAKTRPVNKV